MRIVNWNVNSARTRVDRMTDFLQRHDVDVLAVQETKCTDAQFPYLAFEALGYEVAHYGLNQWNGVAIISRVGIDDVRTSFPGQPGFAKDPSAPKTWRPAPSVPSVAAWTSGACTYPTVGK